MKGWCYCMKKEYKKKGIVLILILGLFLGAVCVSDTISDYFFRSSQPTLTEYQAENDFMQIQLKLISESETFEKYKPDDMIIVDSLKRMEEEGYRFLLGSVCFSDEYYQKDQDYVLVLEEENGNNKEIPLMPKEWKQEDGKITADVFLPIVQQGGYENATLLRSDEVIAAFQLEQL